MASFKLSNRLSWEFWAILGGAVLILVASFWAAAQFVRPAPPDTLTITAGAEGGAYYFFAERYQSILARDGVTLNILPSVGSLENLARLTSDDTKAEIGFVQSGITTSEELPNLVSLGSVAYEPLWVFYRTGKTRITRVSQLLGKKIAVGAEGSGTRKLALEILALNGADENPNHRIAFGGWDAARALNIGEVDAAFFVASHESAIVQQLLGLEGISLMSFELAESYTRRLRALSPLTLPQGVVNFAKNSPPVDTTLLAPTSTLIVRKDMHPALMYLVLRAATEVHSKPGLFNAKGEFPSPKDSDFPLSAEAQRFYKSGTPFLQRYLPFWIANLITRMVVLLIPLLTIAIPLIKVVPLLYSWRVRRRLNRWYGELRFLEDDIEKSADKSHREEFQERLSTIENTVDRLPTPAAFGDRHYTLKQHIDFVRHKLA